MAPRVLHFGTTEIGWECTTKRGCECQIVATELDASSRFKSKFMKINQPAKNLAATVTASTKIVSQKRWHWGNVVEEFTHRKLTVPSDLLPALSGLAEAMSPGSKDNYACGLWKDGLVRSLMWHPDHDYISKNSLGTLPRRHPEYYAPSWSWASIISPINSVKTSGFFSSFEKSGWKNPYPADGEDEPTEDHSKAKIQLLNILDVKISKAGSNPFGPLRSASLIVRGPVAAVWCEELTDDAKSKIVGGSGASRSRSLISSAEGTSPAQITCSLDLHADLSEVSIGEQLLLLFVSESATSEDEYRKLPGGMTELKDRKGGALGLVLQFALGQSEESYRRVGTFAYTGTDLWQKWKSIREERTLVIV